MLTGKHRWFFVSSYVEAAVLMIGFWFLSSRKYGIDFEERTNLSLIFAVIVFFIFALIHLYFGFISIRKNTRYWYRQWNLSYGIGNMCMAGFFLLIAFDPVTHMIPTYISFFLDLFLAFSWLALMLWSVFVVRKGWS